MNVASEGDALAQKPIETAITDTDRLAHVEETSKMAKALAPASTTPEEVAAVTDRMLASSVKLDDLFQLGRYTYIVCLLAELLILFQLGNMLYMMYAGAAPSVVSCGDRTFLPVESVKDRCAFLKTQEELAKNGSQARCTKPELKAQFLSVNYEFDYYCEGTKVVKAHISIQMVGVIFGSMLFGFLSDSFGRRKIMIIALILCIACMIASSFTSHFHSLISLFTDYFGPLYVFTFWRFLVNFFNGGTMVILVVFTVEHYPKKYRFCISNLITWSPNMVVFGIIAYLTGDWRTLTRTSAFLAIPCIGLLLFLSESPRWLVQKQKMDEAKAVIQRFHRIDGRHCDEALLNEVLRKEQERFTESKQKQKKYTYLHLFYTPTFARYTLAVAFSFLVVSLINYSLIFNMEKLSGSIYLNSIFMGLFRYSMNLTIAFLDIKFKKLGRKFAHFVADALAACALVVFIIIYVTGVGLTMISNAAILSVIGFCSLLYTTNGLVSNELFPTGVRNTSYSFGQVLSRIGVVLAPLLFLLADVWTPLPHLILFILAVSDALFFQFNVVETKGKPLQEQFPSKEQRIFYRGDKMSVELLPKGASAKGVDAEGGVKGVDKAQN